MCERELETKQNCNILTSPAPPDIAVCRSRSLGLLLNQKAGGPLCWVRASSTASCHQRVSELIGGTEDSFCRVVAFSTTSCLQLIWSPTHPGSRGPLLPGGGFLCHILSLTSLVPNSLGVLRAPSAGWWFSLPPLVSNSSDVQLTDFLSTPSYIIVQSPTQSLEWHVWSSSSGNNCHAVHRSLSSGASVYDCTMGFDLVPFFQPSPPTRFLLITAIWMCHFLPVHHFGMACLAGSKVNIPQLPISFCSPPRFF